MTAEEQELFIEWIKRSVEFHQEQLRVLESAIASLRKQKELHLDALANMGRFSL